MTIGIDESLCIVIEILCFSTGFSIAYAFLFSKMVVRRLETCFGKKRKNLDSANSKNDIDSTSQTTLSSFHEISNEDDKEKSSDPEVHSFSLKKSSTAVDSSATSSSSYFLMLGSDVMVSVLSYLEPRETLDLLTVPLCKEWRRSYTSDQELWRTICCTKPFSADLSGDRVSSDDSISNCGSIGEFRLIYTSFVRCTRYLDNVKNNNIVDEHNLSSNTSLNETNQVLKFPTFGVTDSLKKYLSRNRETSRLKAEVGNRTAADMSLTPMGVSTDDRNILVSKSDTYIGIFDCCCDVFTSLFMQLRTVDFAYTFSS